MRVFSYDITVIPPPCDNDSLDNFPIVALVKVGIFNPAVRLIVRDTLPVTSVTWCIVLNVSASLFSVPSIYIYWSSSYPLLSSVNVIVYTPDSDSLILLILTASPILKIKFLSLKVVVVLLKYEKLSASNVPFTSKLEFIVVFDVIPLPIITDLLVSVHLILISPVVETIFAVVPAVIFNMDSAVISNCRLSSSLLFVIFLIYNLRNSKSPRVPLLPLSVYIVLFVIVTPVNIVNFSVRSPTVGQYPKNPSLYSPAFIYLKWIPLSDEDIVFKRPIVITLSLISNSSVDILVKLVNAALSLCSVILGAWSISSSVVASVVKLITLSLNWIKPAFIKLKSASFASNLPPIITSSAIFNDEISAVCTSMVFTVISLKVSKLILEVSAATPVTCFTIL